MNAQYIKLGDETFNKARDTYYSGDEKNGILLRNIAVAYYQLALEKSITKYGENSWESMDIIYRIGEAYKWITFDSQYSLNSWEQGVENLKKVAEFWDKNRKDKRFNSTSYASLCADVGGLFYKIVNKEMQERSLEWRLKAYKEIYYADVSEKEKGIIELSLIASFKEVARLSVQERQGTYEEFLNSNNLSPTIEMRNEIPVEGGYSIVQFKVKNDSNIHQIQVG